MPYVDGYVLPIPTKNLPAYKKIARTAGKLWREHGALEYRECASDDLTAQGLLSFAKLTRAKPSETIIFAYITFRSKAHRNQVNAAVMKDPRAKKMASQMMPFDMKRMAYAGFRTIVAPK